MLDDQKVDQPRQFLREREKTINLLLTMAAVLKHEPEIIPMDRLKESSTIKHYCDVSSIQRYITKYGLCLQERN